MNVRSVIIFMFMVISFAAKGQQTDLLMGHWHASKLEQEVLQKKRMVHLSSKPIYLRSETDSLTFIYLTDSAKYYSKLAARVMRDHLFEIKGKDYVLSGDVLLDYGVGRDYKGSDTLLSLFSGIRGLVVQGEIGKRFQFNTGFYEAQMLAPYYLREYRDSTGILPGWGRVKSFKEGGIDFSRSFGKMSFDVLPTLRITLGYGSHFIGNGYRSLLLTDGVMNSPFIEFGWRSRNGVFQYQTWYNTLQTLNRLPLGDTPESLFERKGGNFHYLSVKPISWLELGLFEGMISPRVNDTTIVKTPWNVFQPIIGVNTLVSGWDGKENVYAGMNLTLTFKEYLIYAQFMIDDPTTKRQGFQFGAKSYGAIVNNLDIQIEYNQTSDFAYAGRSVISGLNQFNQPLGHPLGGAVQEWLAIVSYRYERFFGRVKGNWIQHDVGNAGRWNATSMLTSTRLHQKTQQIEFQVGYQLNLKTNAEIVAGYIYRESGVNSNIYMLGIRTNLHNNYFDF